MKMHLRAAIVGCLLACGSASVALFPGTARATDCAGFTDVQTTDSYCAAVNFLKNKAVTSGCTSTTYCPDQFVTRAQMALFMMRLARGGDGNSLGDAYGAIGGGRSNAVTLGTYGVVGGGYLNAVTADNALTSLTYGVIGGGYFNTATNYYSVVGGGESNFASGTGATVAGGLGNSARSTGSTVPGGSNNIAEGSRSFASGAYADADQDDCVVFSLWGNGIYANCNGTTSTFRIGAKNGFSVDYGTQFGNGLGSEYLAIGAPGGHIIDTGHGYLDASGWHSSSDRGLKTEIVEVDERAVLDKVVAMPVSTWRYAADTANLHLGPMAQDFHAAFGLSGNDDKHIGTLDQGGVALAAIKGLNAKLERENADLRARLEALERALSTAH